MGAVVIDASVALALCVPDEETGYAERVIRQLSGDTALVPGIWALEVANGLLVAERRGRIGGAVLARARETLEKLPVTYAGLSLEQALGPVADVARVHNLSAYDASYLELALREGIPLATQDERLTSAAKNLGVRIA